MAVITSLMWEIQVQFSPLPLGVGGGLNRVSPAPPILQPDFGWDPIWSVCSLTTHWIRPRTCLQWLNTCLSLVMDHSG